MRRKEPKFERKQQTSAELLGSCIAFLQRKFYQDHDHAFSKDRQRLLEWVVLWPAKWLDRRGVTISDDQYRALFESVFMDSLRFGDTENITYLPAWLAKVIQSHFAHHGDEIYQAAKNVRTLTEHALLMAGKLVQKQPDPVRELAQAARLIRPKKSTSKVSKKEQLTLL
jgi:hypothetical protein